MGLRNRFGYKSGYVFTLVFQGCTANLGIFGCTFVIISDPDLSREAYDEASISGSLGLNHFTILAEGNHCTQFLDFYKNSDK